MSNNKSSSMGGWIIGLLIAIGAGIGVFYLGKKLSWWGKNSDSEEEKPQGQKRQAESMQESDPGSPDDSSWSDSSSWGSGGGGGAGYAAGMAAASGMAPVAVVPVAGVVVAGKTETAAAKINGLPLPVSQIATGGKVIKMNPGPRVASPIQTARKVSKIGG